MKELQLKLYYVNIIQFSGILRNRNMGTRTYSRFLYQSVWTGVPAGAKHRTKTRQDDGKRNCNYRRLYK